MKKLMLLSVILTQLLLGESIVLQDTIHLDKGKNIPCYVKEIGGFVGFIDSNNIFRFHELKYIEKIYISDLEVVYKSQTGYSHNQEELQNQLTTRNLDTRRLGIILGGGFRIMDEKIKNHLGGYIGPMYGVVGLEIPLPNLPLSVEIMAEAGISGQIQNSKKEIYTYFDVKFGGKWLAFAKHNNFNLIVDGGIMYISSKINDNADGNTGDFYIGPDVEFHEGKLIKSASGVGPYFDFGLTYRFNENWDIAGLIQISSVDLDFTEFKSNALGPGFQLKLYYYPGNR